MTMPFYTHMYWVEIDPKTGSPEGSICWAHYESDKPTKGNWIKVSEIKEVTEPTLLGLINALTRHLFIIGFSYSIEGMVTVTFTDEVTGITEHQHVGFPDCDKQMLEKHLINCLSVFLETLERNKEDV